MSEDYEDIIEENIIDEEIDEDIVDDKSEGKFDKLLESDAKKYKLSGMFKDWYLDYASYVILHRAVPHIIDGLKPVQRRVLHAMYKVDTGAFTKVATLVGEAMKYHPHGDASILGAMVQLGQKGFAIDCQGNWGNILTGDANAAMRYIEARLSKFAKEVIFDPRITNWMNSYDGRNQEPTELPVRFPLLLAQGTEGIGVGMSSKILPHNFNELIDASIKILKNEPYEIYPDFPTGGYADCSKYNQGKRGGIVKVRAKIEKIDKSTIAITEIPYGKTTGVLIQSIMNAKDKGKIKFKKIDDITTDKVNVLIHLPADVSPDKTIDALYAFTDCETTIAPNACVILDNKPAFLSVNDVLEYSTMHTKDLLLSQLRFRMNELENSWHYTSLERIFFENKVYKILEQDFESWDAQKDAILAKMKEWENSLHRAIVMEDIDKLVDKPVRKLSKFDTKILDEKLLAIEEEMRDVQDKIDHIVDFTIDWFRMLKEKYGKAYPRRTEIRNFDTIEATKVAEANEKLYINRQEGFLGMGLKKDEFICNCSDIDDVIIFYRNGTYKIVRVADKMFIGKDVLYVNVYKRNDTRTIYNAVYRDGKVGTNYIKRFAVTSAARDKEYDLTRGTEGSRVLYFSANPNGEAETVKVILKPKPRQKLLVFEKDFSEIAIKGRGSMGNILTKADIHKITLKQRGSSTLGGRMVWFDRDVLRLNYDGRGEELGEFHSEDQILVIQPNGDFYATNFDLSNHYDSDIQVIEKYSSHKVWTAVLYDADQRYCYLKRFQLEVSGRKQNFLGDNPKSRLLLLTDEPYPRILARFGGADSFREPLEIDAESFVGVKGFKARGKRVSNYLVEMVEALEPTRFPDETNEELPEEPISEEESTEEPPQSQTDILDEITGQMKLFDD